MNGNEQAKQLSLEEIDKLIGNGSSEVNTGLGETIDEMQMVVSDVANNADLEAADALADSFYDSYTGEEIPLANEGFTPNYAKNESVVDPIDRLKLSAGNKEGKLSYLKTKFQDAQVDKHGNFVVQKDDIWYKVDPQGLGTIDDWTNTKQLMNAGKELAMDLADIAPELAAAGVGIGAGLATGGMAFLPLLGIEATAAAGTAAYRTILGRIAGTYEATPEETIRDIGMEGLLTTAGVGVLAGVRPGGEWLAKNIPAISKSIKAFNDIPEGMGTRVGKWFARQAGVGAEAYEIMATKPKPLKQTVKALTKDAKELAGDFRQNFFQVTQEAQLDDIFNFAKQAKKLKTKLYTRFENKIIANAGDDFVDPTARSAMSAAIDSVQAGMTKVKVRVVDAGDSFSTSAAGKAFAKATGQGAEPAVAKWKTLNTDEAVELLLNRAKAGKEINTKLIKFESPSAAEISRLAQSGKFIDSSFGELVGKEEGVKALAQFNEQLTSMAGTKKLPGAIGVKNAMKQSTVFKNNIDNLQSMLKNVKATGAASKLSQIGGRFKAAQTGSLDEASNGLYSELNSTYSLLKKNLAPLEEMVKASPEKSMKAAQTYLGQISSTRNSGILSRKGMREAQEAAKRLDPGTSKILENLQENMALKQAALEWNPIAKGKGGTELAMGAYAVGSANVPLLGAIGAKAAAGSRSLNKAATKSTRFLWNQVNLLKSLDGASKEAFLTSPVGAGASAFFGGSLLATDPDLRQTLLNDVPLRDEEE